MVLDGSYRQDHRLVDVFAELNPQQREAVAAPPGPILVLAGPGSGKTRVLTYRIAHLVLNEGADAQAILAVTFTNKAAREMESRVRDLLAEAGASAAPAHLGTFHSLAARMLRRDATRLPFDRNFVIFDDSDQRALLRQVLKDLNLDPKRVQPGKVHSIISEAKNELVGVEGFTAETYFAEIARRVYERYQAYLLDNNAVDFDDLLFWAVRLLQENEVVRRYYRSRYQHLLVDEFQDTNTAQYVLTRSLAGESPDLFAVGDADQSIYSWRGADYRNVRRFQRDYPQARVIILEQNYRSTQQILDVAMRVIDRLKDRQKKALFTERGPGEKVYMHEAYDEDDEASFVVDAIASLTAQGEADPGDCAVMYRTNAQSRALEERFLKAGLPYRLVGAQRFYGRREVKDIIAFLRLIHNPNDQVSLFRILNVPARGIGAKTVEHLQAVCEAQELGPASVLLDLAGEGGGGYGEAFPTQSATALAAFGRLLAGWSEIKGEVDLPDLMDRVISDVGYRAYVEDGTDEGYERWANVQELRAVAEEFRGLDLGTFLENVALVSDQDTLTDAQNAPALLTLHAAKGLEFPVVFIVGLDDGLLPHQRSFDDPEAMAEERRLFYVGITRAKDRLYLVRAFRRHQFGSSTVSEPSRFLDDLPPDLVEGDLVSSVTPAQAYYNRQTSWDSPQPVVDEPRFSPGMRVAHPSFGEGIVLESRVDGGDEEVTVSFERVGEKHLVASLAGLKILEN
jgi:DNA helicase-2/ATP-dependent DNA helicase PcrA